MPRRQAFNRRCQDIDSLRSPSFDPGPGNLLPLAQYWCIEADMKADMKATIAGALGGALGGALVLLVIFAFSWIAIHSRVSNIEEQIDESSAGEDPKPAKDEMIEKQGEEEEGEEEDEAPESLSDWEAAHVAAESGDTLRLRFLILERGVHVDAEDKHAMTLLQVASRHGHLEVVKFLIDNGATVNAAELDDRTALHFAVIRGRLSITHFLLERGANVNLRKRLGLTPLHVVAQTSHTDLMKVLLEHGADMEAPDDKGNTPLDWAITFGTGVMVQALLEQGALLRDRDADGKRPMERAVRGWDVLKVDVLAKRGQHFPTNQRDMQRVTMLYAMKKNQTKEETTDSLIGT